MIEWRIGDNLAHLAAMATVGDTVDLVATSPPFLGLRDYDGLAGQHGAETTPAAWLATQLDVIEACGRVLADHGSIAWEVGDTFAGSGGSGGDYNAEGMREGQPKVTGSGRRARVHGSMWPLPKSLCGTPQALMVSLAYGRNILAFPDQDEWRTFEPWIVRNTIAWVRTNAPVGALADKWRPATSHIIVATRSPNRWWDPTGTRAETGGPLLDWWQVNNPGTVEPHYAVWPSEIVARLVKAMCPQRVCTVCGEPSRPLIETRPSETQIVGRRAGNSLGSEFGDPEKLRSRNSNPVIVGWTDCGHGDQWRSGRALDPYAGSGTTLAVADWLGRDATGIDLNPRNRDEIWPNRQGEAVRQLLGAPAVTTLAGQLAAF